MYIWLLYASFCSYIAPAHPASSYAAAAAAAVDWPKVQDQTSLPYLLELHHELQSGLAADERGAVRQQSRPAEARRRSHVARRQEPSPTAQRSSTKVHYLAYSALPLTCFIYTLS